MALDLGPAAFVQGRRVIIDPANLPTTTLAGPLGLLGINVHGVHTILLARRQVLPASIPRMLLASAASHFAVPLIDSSPPFSHMILSITVLPSHFSCFIASNLREQKIFFKLV